ARFCILSGFTRDDVIFSLFDIFPGPSFGAAALSVDSIWGIAMRVGWLTNGVIGFCLVVFSLRRRSIVRWIQFGWDSGSDDLRLQIHTLRFGSLSCLSVRPHGSTNMGIETFSFGENIARRGSWTRRYSLFPFLIAFYSLQILTLLFSLLICHVDTMTSSGGPAWSLQFTEADLKDARERSELSLLARIFWNETRDLRYVENSFIPVWKCDRVRIFDVGYGLYQFIFPSVSKRNFVLAKQPWYYQKAIVHFTDDMNPSKELFDALRVMPLWVKIIGMPLAYRTVAVGRKLLEPMGEVLRMGYFDAHKPEGCYVKGRVRMDLFNSFLGTAPDKGEDGSSFQVFFQYEGVPCICYLCGYMGHVMGDCYHEDLVFDPLIRDSWICGVTDPDESTQTRRIGGQARVGGRVVEGPQPALTFPSPSVDSQIVIADAGKGIWVGPDPRPSSFKKAAGSAGPSGVRMGPSPLPKEAAFPPAPSAPLEVVHGAAPPLAAGLETPSGLEAGLQLGPDPVEAAPLSGSTKRKLEAEFEGDNPALGDKQHADGSTPSQGATFDPDALFVSGSEEDEELESDKEDTNQEVEVANLDRPPIAK
ncbi:Uncharacterized protein At4g02000, partial [Linum perenne]